MAVDSLAGDLRDEMVVQTWVTSREIQEVTSSTHSGIEKLQVAILKLQNLVTENITIQEPKVEHIRESTLTKVHYRPQFSFQQELLTVIQCAGLAPSARQPSPRYYTGKI